MDAIIISVGTELVTGQCVDTNSAWLAARLAERGIQTVEHVTVGDELDRLSSAIRRAIAWVDVVILTGGLGPTLDDITREAIAGTLGVELVEDAEALGQIEAFFRRINRPMSDSNRRQAMAPRGCRMIPNARGTAPGIQWQGRRDGGTEGRRGDDPPQSHLGKGGGPNAKATKRRRDEGEADASSLGTGARRLWALPGVPSEMKAMFEAAVAPALSTAATGGGAAGRGRSIVMRRLNCFGITEAKLGEQIAELMARGRNPNVGTTASGAVLAVRIVAEAESPQEASRLAQADAEVVRSRLGEAVFGEEDETLQAAVARLLIGQKKTIATAESCTGGLLSERLTEIPGSSAYFLRGLVTYSDQSKIEGLGVPAELIREHGAVSEPAAAAMASGCQRVAGSAYAISITGVAGPSGGSIEKPVGLVYIGLATDDGASVKRLTLGEHLSRSEVRDRAVKAALNLLRLRLLGARV